MNPRVKDAKGTFNMKEYSSEFEDHFQHEQIKFSVKHSEMSGQKIRITGIAVEPYESDEEEDELSGYYDIAFEDVMDLDTGEKLILEGISGYHIDIEDDQD